MDTEQRPVDHDPEPTGDDAVVDVADAGDADDTGQDEALMPSLRDVEPDWEAADADILDQHRDVPFDDER